MDSELIQKYIELQPVLVTLILSALVFLLFGTAVDFVFSLFMPKWHSPNGFKVKSRKNDKKD